MVPAAEDAAEPEASAPPPIAPPPAEDPSAAAMPAADVGAAQGWAIPGVGGRVPPPPSSRAPGGAAIPPLPPIAMAHPEPIRSAQPPAEGGGERLNAAPHHAREELGLPHTRRLRRSRPTDMPPRPAERYDVPEDAAGRVQYLEQPVVIEHPRAMPHRPPSPLARAPIPRADEIAGWIAVGALAAVLLIVFIIGMKLTS